MVNIGIANPPEFDPNVLSWQEHAPPPAKDLPASAVWLYSATRSNVYWQVSVSDTAVIARLGKGHRERSIPRPKVGLQDDEIKFISDCMQVEGGWLVGLDHGEFGGDLFWLSKDGSRRQQISEHTINQFVRLPDSSILAIEGGNDRGIPDGSLITIEKPTLGHGWQAKQLFKFSSEPLVCTARASGDIVIALTSGLVEVPLSATNQVREIIDCARWDWMEPNSIAFAPDETKAYLGLQQYVAEVDLATRNVRYLVPSKAFVMELDKDEQNRLRKTFSGPRDLEPPFPPCWFPSSGR